ETYEWAKVMAQVPCPGYVGPDGKKFFGKLSLLQFKAGEPVHSWLIQGEEDRLQCTPPETAKKRLQAAKDAFAAAGIDLKSKGTTVGFGQVIQSGANAPYLLEYLDEAKAKK